MSPDKHLHIACYSDISHYIWPVNHTSAVVINRCDSWDSNLLDVCPSRCVAVGDQSFATAGPRLWNSLPADVQSASSLTTFRQKL